MPRPRKAPRTVRFTAEEDALLRKHYPEGGSVQCKAFLPKRSHVAIRRRARRLKLDPPKQGISDEGKELIRAWVVDEDRTYRTFAALAEHLKVSAVAVSSYARTLGYKPRPYHRNRRP